MATERRQLTSKLRSQIPASLFSYVVAGFTLFLAGLTYVLFMRLQQVIELVFNEMGSSQLSVALAVIIGAKMIVPSAFLSLGMFVFFIEYRRKKQVVEESLALIAQIQQLKNGQFANKRELRKYDDFRSVMSELHSLADVLNKK